MESLFAHFNTVLKLLIYLSMTSFIACRDQNNDDSYAYISASIQGNSPQTKKSRPKTISIQQGKSNIPAGVTKIDFIITDSEGETTTGSLNVGPQTDTISLQVLPHRDLNVTINVYSGEILTFQGQSPVAALAPGQTFLLSIEADPVQVVLNLDSQGASALEGSQNYYLSIYEPRKLTFTVTLSTLANGNVTVDYATSRYNITLGTLTIPSGFLSGTIELPISGDVFAEPDETFTLILSNTSPNVILGNATAPATIIDDDFDIILNDTGVTLCANYISASSINTDNNSVNCLTSEASETNNGLDINGEPVPGAQDALVGRDADSLNNIDSDGHAGFSFTKLDANGIPLNDQTLDYVTQPWACVQDNISGLTWEVKTNGGPQNSTDTFTWYNSTGINDAGDPGLTSGGICADTSNCDTEKYIINNNTETDTTPALCGLKNWRLPTGVELLSITDSSQVAPAIDINYFPNTQVGPYWTSMSAVRPGSTHLAWAVNFNTGSLASIAKSQVQVFTRLVARQPPAVIAL